MTHQGRIVVFGLLDCVVMSFVSPLVEHHSTQLVEFFNGHLFCLMGVKALGDFLFKPIHELAELLSHQRIGAELLEQLGFVLRDESLVVVVSVVVLHAYQP